MGLVNRLDRAQAHGHCGKLPVIRHQPGVGVGGQAVAVHLAAEVVQVGLVYAALQVGARIHARGAVPLVEHQVTRVAVLGAAEKVIETHVVQGGAGRETGNMPAQGIVVVIGPHHHRQRIPAHQGTDPAFHEQVPRHHLLFAGQNGVGKGGGDGRRQAQALLLGVLGQFPQQERGALRTVVPGHFIQCVQPFPGFRGIHVFCHKACLCCGMAPGITETGHALGSFIELTFLCAVHKLSEFTWKYPRAHPRRGRG